MFNWKKINIFVFLFRLSIIIDYTYSIESKSSNYDKFLLTKKLIFLYLIFIFFLFNLSVNISDGFCSYSDAGFINDAYDVLKELIPETLPIVVVK